MFGKETRDWLCDLIYSFIFDLIILDAILASWDLLFDEQLSIA